MKLGIRQTFVSASVFVALLLLLSLFDGRVRREFAEVVHGDSQVPSSSFTMRMSDFGGAVLSVVRYHTLENGPMVVFAVVGGALTLFMLRT